MRISSAALLAASSASLVAAESVSYAGHKVFRLIPKDGNALDDSFRSLVKDLDLSVWQQPGRQGGYADVAVSPSQLASFAEGIASWAYAEVMHDNLQTSVERESDYQAYQAGSANDTWFNSYHKYDEHVAWLASIQSQHSAHASLFDVGTSVEGRNITGIHIHGSSSGVKPAIVLQAHVHAREWIASMTAEYLIYQLLDQYESDPDVKAMLEKFDIYVTPIGNPDGFLYTQTSDRMWRKNRRVNKGSRCVGVDPNRNWPIDWQGSSDDPCDETFRGAGAGSEPEVQGLMNVVKSVASKQGVKLFIDYHSYQQVMSVPYAYDCSQPKNVADLSKLAKGATDVISKTHGVRYKSGSTCDLIGAGSGGGDDWSLAVGGAEYSYTIELRDTGRNGFVLPPEQIRPTGEENWAGVKYMLSTL